MDTEQTASALANLIIAFLFCFFIGAFIWLASTYGLGLTFLIVAAVLLVLIIIIYTRYIYYKRFKNRKNGNKN